MLDGMARRFRANLGSEASYSITSSAVASSEGGTVRPRALAVFRLIANLKRVGCSTGISAGFAPLRNLVDVGRWTAEKTGRQEEARKVRIGFVRGHEWNGCRHGHAFRKAFRGTSYANRS